jgi:SAM-dependent methyltransferase
MAVGAKDTDSDFYTAAVMPDRDWWQALWPDPEEVMRKVGAAPGIRTVDLCCGDGYFTAPLSRLVQPAEVIAVDLSPDMLLKAREEVAAKGADNVTFIEGNADDLPEFVTDLVDLVIIGNTFHGVPDQTELAQSVRQVLKLGGHFVVINWYPIPREETQVLDMPRGPATDLRMSPEATRGVVEPAGLREVGVIDVGPYHYAAKFMNP